MSKSNNNLFVKLPNKQDVENIRFVAWLTGQNKSEAIRTLFAKEAENLRTKYPQSWETFCLSTYPEAQSPAPETAGGS